MFQLLFSDSGLSPAFCRLNPTWTNIRRAIIQRPPNNQGPLIVPLCLPKKGRLTRIFSATNQSPTSLSDELFEMFLSQRVIGPSILGAVASSCGRLPSYEVRTTGLVLGVRPLVPSGEGSINMVSWMAAGAYGIWHEKSKSFFSSLRGQNRDLVLSTYRSSPRHRCPLSLYVLSLRKGWHFRVYLSSLNGIVSDTAPKSDRRILHPKFIRDHGMQMALRASERGPPVGQC